MNQADQPQMMATTYQAALNASAGAVAGIPDWMQWQQRAPLVAGGFVMPAQSPPTTVEKAAVPNTRLVKVFIADPDENVPLDKRLLYRGEEAMTDLTDQELFFEVPITDLLLKHNEYRKTLEDKKAKKEKPVMLEPIRVRDLKMLVVALASF